MSSLVSSGTVVVAVDFGATSIRVCRVDLEARPVETVVVHRHTHGPVPHPDGSLRWDWDRLVAEARVGLESALDAGPVASIGIDTWGLDYGLLDPSGHLVAPPHCYRDPRTAGWRGVLARIGAERFYDISGIQFMPGNSIFQLAAHDPEEKMRASRFLMLPELLIHQLGGGQVAEATSASTTGLVDLRSGDWSGELIDAAGADPDWFLPIEQAGAVVGDWRGTPIRLVGGHDTASAVVAMSPHPGPGTAFLSGGTLFLVGRELPAPDLSVGARTAGFSNERGTFGSIRFLKNQPGTWLIEECRRMWADPPVAGLLAAAADVRTPVPVIDVDAETLVTPDDMPAEICALAGLAADTDHAVIARVIVESLAARVAEILDRLGDVDELAVFGGAARSGLLLDRIEIATGLDVRTGPAEATAVGNALTQGVQLGRFADQAEARAALAG